MNTTCQSSESLAGRIHYIEVRPFNLAETLESHRLWSRGGFPRSYLAPSEESSFQWRKDYALTFLERDIPALGIQVAPMQLRCFWSMLAHYHGNVLNASEIGNSLGISHTTVRRYIDILSGTFMTRVLSPWFENLAKQKDFPLVQLSKVGILTIDDMFNRGQFPEGFVEKLKEHNILKPRHSYNH